MAKKGSEFERSFCKELSLWWSSGRFDDLFWRSQTSGARATQRSKTGQRTSGQHGDIAFTDPSGEPLLDFTTIELKRGYPKATVHDLLDKSRTSARQPFEKMVDQALDAYHEAGSFTWWVVTRRDRRRTVITMPKDDCHQLRLYAPHVETFARYTFRDLEGSRIDLVTLPWDEFTHHVDPQLIRDLVKEGI